MIVVLRILLAIMGVVIIWLGLNIGLGGIATLGWQGPSDFFTITNKAAFHVQDNHVRFIGGVWLGVGMFFIAGAILLHQLSSVLKALVHGVYRRFSAPERRRPCIVDECQDSTLIDNGIGCLSGIRILDPSRDGWSSQCLIL